MNDNQYAGGFNSFMSKYRAYFLKEILENKKIENILDIGCGTGDVFFGLNKISPIIKNCKRIDLVEPNINYLNSAKKKFKLINKVNFLNLSIEDLNPNIRYDLITIVDVLEHVDRPLSILKSVKKILDKDGILVIIVPNAKSLHRYVGMDKKYIKSLYALSQIDHEVGHQRYFDSEKLYKLVIKAGFKMVHKSGILLKPLNNKKMEGFPENYYDVLYELGKKIPNYCAEVAFVIAN